MEICALSSTILIDDDGIYDPNDFNDRLLLGLKGTMSEAELHFLRERMRGGALSKAMRGELKSNLPAGYLYDEAGKVIKDPDILTPSRAQKVLRSPTYAGVYTYGRIQSKNTVKGKKRRPVPEEQWTSYIENHLYRD